MHVLYSYIPGEHINTGLLEYWNGRLGICKRSTLAKTALIKLTNNKLYVQVRVFIASVLDLIAQNKMLNANPWLASCFTYKLAIK